MEYSDIDSELLQAWGQTTIEQYVSQIAQNGSTR